MGDESRRSELILFYMEPLAATGFKRTDLFQGEQETPQWKPVVEGIGQRSRRAFQIVDCPKGDLS